MRVAVLLFFVTLLSMFRVGAEWDGVNVDAWPPLVELLRGYSFALPLMAILLSHELGHYFAARIHGVDASPPFFIPMPFPPLGTFGAVIQMRGAIKLRNALFDIGASGPLCGLIVALPVLIYGISTSEVQPLDPTLEYFIEGRSILYLSLVHWLKGPIPPGSDIMLTPTALAGWAGLLITMINLVPVGQLDGGHVAYALFGVKQDDYSRWIRRALLVFGLGLSTLSFVVAWQEGASESALWSAAASGVHWLVWWVLLAVLARVTGARHPPTEPSSLSPGRRALAWFTLALFVLLFMPTWASERLPYAA